MKKEHQHWLLFITGLILCLTAAVLAVVDALIPRNGGITLNITLLAVLFLMGLILAGRGLSRLIRSKKNR